MVVEFFSDGANADKKVHRRFEAVKGPCFSNAGFVSIQGPVANLLEVCVDLGAIKSWGHGEIKG